MEKRAGDFAFTEGPTCDAAGRLIACADERNELVDHPRREGHHDREGLRGQSHLYLTGDGVRVFDRAGRQVEHIQVAEPWTANVSFCGADRRTLFITASKGLYSVRTRTRGADPAK